MSITWVTLVLHDKPVPAGRTGEPVGGAAGVATSRLNDCVALVPVAVVTIGDTHRIVISLSVPEVNWTLVSAGRTPTATSRAT